MTYNDHQNPEKNILLNFKNTCSSSASLVTELRKISLNIHAVKSLKIYRATFLTKYVFLHTRPGRSPRMREIRI